MKVDKNNQTQKASKENLAKPTKPLGQDKERREKEEEKSITCKDQHKPLKKS